MNEYKNKFEVCVRGVILNNKGILICKNKEKDYYFFPGGHIDFGESAEPALTRELKEELNISIKEIFFIGAMENVYTEDNEKHHEINLVFEVLVNKIEDKSKEDHLQFFLMDKEQIKKEKVLPIVLKNAILKWLSDKKQFWVSEI